VSASTPPHLRSILADRQYTRGAPAQWGAIHCTGEHAMTITVEQRLKELGLQLPPPPLPIGNYVAGVITGNLLFMSGCGPRSADGTYLKGKVGSELTLEQGYESARLVALNMLANIRSVLGSLDRIDRVVKTLGMVNCTPEFADQPKVINGFSDLFVELLGVERGRAARSAVGMMALPGQIPVEVEMVLQVKPA
jgi:enamine deaminase RidA (YjgF/YER057c/UK114 family)